MRGQSVEKLFKNNTIIFESSETFENFLKLMTISLPVIYYPFIYGSI
jgi:hypothetical protein